MKWIELQNKLEIEELLIASDSHQVAIFKHSTRCGISKMVLKNFEREIDSLEIDGISFYFLDLIAYREVSSAISEVFDIQHESPQLIVVHERKVVSHSSHSNISASHLSVSDL